MVGRELQQATGVVPRVIGPGELRLGRLTVVVRRGRATLRYAREPVGRARAEVDDIAAAWRRALARLEARSLPPDELLPRLAAAYRKLAITRAPLVAIRAKLAYARAQFAWDLARLRRERRLSLANKRLDLGIATGHSTSRRSRVVWIEDDGGGGAFYETLRFV